MSAFKEGDEVHIQSLAIWVVVKDATIGDCVRVRPKHPDPRIREEHVLSPDLVKHTSPDKNIEELIEASSLGTRKAKELRRRVPKEMVDAVLARADELEAQNRFGGEARHKLGIARGELADLKNTIDDALEKTKMVELEPHYPRNVIDFHDVSESDRTMKGGSHPLGGFQLRVNGVGVARFEDEKYVTEVVRCLKFALGDPT